MYSCGTHAVLYHAPSTHNYTCMLICQPEPTAAKTPPLPFIPTHRYSPCAYRQKRACVQETVIQCG